MIVDRARLLTEYLLMGQVWLRKLMPLIEASPVSYRWKKVLLQMKICLENFGITVKDQEVRSELESNADLTD